MKNYILISMACIAFQFSSYAQNEENKWVFGLGMNAIDFYPTGEPEAITGNPDGFGNEFFNVNDHWNKFGFPKIHVTRHIWKNFSFDAAFSMNKIDKVGDFEVDDLSYYALDGSIQYSILKNNKTYYPYVFAGGGYTWIDEKGAGTFNAGLGMTYWFIEKLGLNGNAMFKHTPSEYENVIQHFHYSVSLVYRLGGRGNSRLKCL